jgi:nitroreductase
MGDADAMDVMEAIYSRRSVRAYTDQPVDKTTVEDLIKAATHAPSSMNEQPWAFAVIQNPTQLAARSLVRPYQSLRAEASQDGFPAREVSRHDLQFRLPYLPSGGDAHRHLREVGCA